jgi:2-polyprenyl-3-methyl-5-hydroxy-6-metoxy-1,4-benzoquinol methylase
MNYKYSCVLDYNPLMAAQAFIWLNSLKSKQIDGNDIYIHLIGNVPEAFEKMLKVEKVNIIQSQPYNSQNKYCNKLLQLDTFTNLDRYDYVFLMDCDTAIVSMEGLNLKNEVYAKVVDFPNPPIAILEKIFEANNLAIDTYETTFKTKDEQFTDWNNCNGGLYIISSDFIKKLNPLWKHYANWCIENNKLFTETYSKHADQVGFSLAMNSLGKKVTHLGVEWNYPTHVSKNLLPEVEPKIIHFHNKIDAHMNLINTGLKIADNSIEKINQSTSNNLKGHLNNALFRNLRYAQCPELGSGVGSRGDILDYKKRLLKYITYDFKEKNIIDVGCGDLELTKEFNFKKYLGLDISEESLKICKNKRPDWRFENVSITDDSIKEVDLIICFDVLIHQSSLSDFREMISTIVSKSQNRVIIGAYNEPPEFKSDITYYHNGILDELKQYNKFNVVGIVGKYRDVTVISASLYKSNHSRDLSSEMLNKAFEEVNRPDILHFLVDVSRSNLGFYSSHYPRVFEYTWLFEQLEDKTGAVIDIGAGVCPLPIALALNNFKMTTVDSHSKIRKLENKAEWNEWGFLDYSTLNSDIQSHNIDFLKFKSKKLFDFIYSISVIEHIPKANRLKVLKNASKLLKKGGKLLLTIDLYPNTESLWNLSEDKEVEPIEVHGTVNTFKNELKKYGFEIVQEDIQRDIPNSRTDVYYVIAALKRKPFFIFN